MAGTDRGQVMEATDGNGEPPADVGAGTISRANADAGLLPADDGEEEASQMEMVDERYLAVQAIRRAMRENGYDRYETLVVDIDAAAEAYPEDPTIAMYAATLRLWRLAEGARDPNLNLFSQAIILGEARARFDAAIALSPSDGRLRAWSASLTMRAAQTTGSAVGIEQGKQELEEAVPLYPAFGSFVQGALLGTLPTSDPDLATAAEKMYATLESCGATLDRQNPVFTLPHDPARGGLCGNSQWVPHNLEGLFLNLGDVMIKAGNVDAASVMYANAQRVPAFETWLLRDELEARIENAQANADSLTDADPANDFKTPLDAGYFCVGCHAE